MAEPDTPCECHICGDLAIGIGMSAKPPHQWVCAPCSLLIEDWKRIKRPSAYTLKAIEMAGEKAGALLDGWGKTDLAEMDEGEWRQFCKAMCLGFGDSMRRLIRDGEAPF